MQRIWTACALLTSARALPLRGAVAVGADSSSTHHTLLDERALVSASNPTPIPRTESTPTVVRAGLPLCTAAQGCNTNRAFDTADDGAVAGLAEHGHGFAHVNLEDGWRVLEPGGYTACAAIPIVTCRSTRLGAGRKVLIDQLTASPIFLGSF